MDKLNEIDLMTIEDVVSFALREMEKEEEKGGTIDGQKELDLRMLKRKIALMRMQERK